MWIFLWTMSFNSFMLFYFRFALHYAPHVNDAVTRGHAKPRVWARCLISFACLHVRRMGGVRADARNEPHAPDIHPD